MTLIKYVLAAIYLIADCVLIFDYVNDKDEKNDIRKFNLHLDNLYDNSLCSIYVN